MATPLGKYGFMDLTGQTFCFLTVLEYAGKHKERSSWRCKCQCGNERVVLGKNLKNGDTTSCGCRQLTHAIRHGMSHSVEYQTWADMLQRCKDRTRKDYGGRGITVCERWLKFENFFEDMGHRPSDEFSIGRIDNSAGYSPENCRWETQLEQNNNMRSNHVLTFNDKSMTLAQWSRELGVSKHLLFYRIKAGWSVEKTLTAPRKTKRSREFKIWRDIVSRCTCKTDVGYESCGGRGISICEDWLESFDIFCLDMGTCPSDKHSIDRRDSDGNYCKENCIWNIGPEQLNDIKHKHYLTFNGETMTCTEWCVRLGMNRVTLYKRLREGWSTEKALTTPVQKRSKAAHSKENI